MIGYYTTATIDGGTANQRIKYLIGPFIGPRGPTAALSMVKAARSAAMRSGDDRYKIASFGTAKLSQPKLPPGSLDLSLIDINDFWPVR